MSRPSSDQQQPLLSANTIADVLLSSDLLETLPDAIVAVDRDGIIVQVNSQTQALFGYTRDELIGQKVELLVPESYRSRHHHHRQSFAETPKTRRMGADQDLDGIITSWNKGAERIYGYTPEEAVGKHISILAPSDRPDEIPEILQKIA